MNFSLSRFFVCLVLLFSSATMFADFVRVDCTGATPGAFTNFATALASLNPAVPNTIEVHSDCTESITVSGFNQLFITGSPGGATITAPGPFQAVLKIFGSKDVAVDHLTFSGGQGIQVLNSSMFLQNGAMQNAFGNAVGSLDSQLTMGAFAVQNNGSIGIDAAGGILRFNGGVNVSNNGNFGIRLQHGRLEMTGPDPSTGGADNVISGNFAFGISAESGAQLEFVRGQITNNGYMGIRLVHASLVTMTRTNITGNKGVGVHVSGTSHAHLELVTINGNGAVAAGAGGGLQTNFGAAGGIEIVENSDAKFQFGVDVSNNLGTGVFTDGSSMLTSLGFNTVNNNTGNGFLLTGVSIAHFFGDDTATGNTLENFECDSSSVLIAKLGAFGGARCANVKIK